VDGFINFNKAAGVTSHDAVNFVRKILQTRKVGHGGTLDPAATGILPLAIGRATKFIEYLADCDKSYRAEILFGTATDSGDLDGKILQQEENFSMPSVEELQAAAKKFVGEVEQTPPKFSAIKINGRKAYDLARKDIDFEMPRRKIKINSFKIVQVEKNFVTVEVDCAKGTYIRTLAEDFGKVFELPATLKSLQRLRVGNFYLHESVTLEELRLSPEKYLRTIESCLEFEKFSLPSHRVKAFLNGLTTTVNLPDAVLTVYDGENFLGIGEIFSGELRAKKLACI